MEDPAVTIALYALIASIATAIISAIVAVLIAWLNYKQETRSKALANATAEVKDTLETNTATVSQKMADLKEVTDKTHEAVNGSMGAQLLINFRLAKRLADETRKPADRDIAKLAEKAYKSHTARP